MKIKALQLYTAMMTWVNFKKHNVDQNKPYKEIFILCNPIYKAQHQDAYIKGKIIKQNKEGKKKIVICMMVNFMCQPA